MDEGWDDASLNVLVSSTSLLALLSPTVLTRMEDESQIIVYDLGGGTSNVSLLSIDYGVYEVLLVVLLAPVKISRTRQASMSPRNFELQVLASLSAKSRRPSVRCPVNRASGSRNRESLEDGNAFSETLTRQVREAQDGPLPPDLHYVCYAKQNDDFTS